MLSTISFYIMKVNLVPICASQITTYDHLKIAYTTIVRTQPNIILT